eukprot:NODE_117_length_18986_cov_0.639540.p2 type:complete len:356 gc:universal NODE_117_length_18986_cov_0.639540:1312-245(-)
MEQFTKSFSLLTTNEKSNIEEIANYIMKENPSNIICMTGAGISTSSGIPDFRSSNGLYQQELGVPYPEAVFELSYFKKEPKPFYKLAKQLYGNYTPTPTHYFLKLLHEKKILKRIYTQNIDALEITCGIPEDMLVEAHGSFLTSTCILCKTTFNTIEKVIPIISIDEIPYCHCGGFIKPNIVFFGENLPNRYFELQSSDFEVCDLLIVIGTSLAVQPFAGLINKVECPRLLINMESVGTSLGFGERKSDVEYLGKCDDAIMNLIQLLNWETHFEQVMKHRSQFLKVNARDAKDARKKSPQKQDNHSVKRKISIPSDVSGIFTASETTDVYSPEKADSIETSESIKRASEEEDSNK